MSNQIKPARLFRSNGNGVVYVQRFTPAEANLQYLSCGEFHLPAGARSRKFCFPNEESLLFVWRGHVRAGLEGRCHELAPYDILYVPRSADFFLSNPALVDARVVHASAPASNVHPVFHGRFSELSGREERVRRLRGKNVYLMFDVSEGADKLVAGYTFFEPQARSWPPHNHTDQEEAYIFLKGQGAMEVYDTPESMSFVHSVGEGDIVSIPMLNYHPVFSHEQPLEFIWCIAGARYWVGDKNQDFLKGEAQAITT